MSHRVLVVEDDRTIALAIVERLAAEGFAATSIGDGRDAVADIERQPPDIVVLDLMLPGLDGIEVCRRIQSIAPTVPVIILTARTDEADKLVGLGVGADDYVTKPFSQKELVARIRSTLRRIEVTRADAAEPSDDIVLVDGPVEVDRNRRTVRNGDDLVDLTPIEFDLYVALLRRRGVVRRRDDLLYEVWGHRDGFGHRTVDSHVRSIRRKLGDDAVRTVHGVGYASRDAST